jgi:diguanylate cyclase (GGDEF)-like protein/PAS domain S-box-containing protein
VRSSGTEDVRGPRAHIGLAGVAGAFLAVIAAVTGVALFALEVLTSARAYVGGEGLWSKAEKDAAAALTRYITDGDESAYEEFRAQLAVPLGDRRAREELEKPAPDLAVARAGFLAGRNHPDDVDGMIKLFRRFRRVEPLDRAIGVWKRGDELIAELREVGERVHAAGPDASPDVRRDERRRVELVNARVTLLEDEFSATLSDAARRVRTMVQTALLGMAALLGGLALAATVRVGRSLSAHEDALVASERRYRQSFEGNLAGMYRAAEDGRILDGNPALARILGRTSSAEVQGLRLEDLEVAGEGRAREAGTLVDHEACLRRPDGSAVWVLLHENLLGAGPDGAVREGSVIDVTDRRRTGELRQFQATHDALTSLPNRVLFRDRLQLAIRHAEREAGRLAVLFLDLDDFKRVNDSLGHAVGDEVLVGIAARLTSCLRADDTVARHGGDEFIFLIPGISKESDVESLVAKILARVAEPLPARGREFRLTASVGVAMFPEAGGDAETLVANADAAMYRAKTAGRSGFRFARAGPGNAGT